MSSEERILSAMIHESGQRALWGLHFPAAHVCRDPSAAELQDKADNLAELAASQRVAEEQARATGQYRQDLNDRISHDIGLARSTDAFLMRARALLIDGTQPASDDRLATFRAELQPLAKSYGVKIVLVGDRTTATLVML